MLVVLPETFAVSHLWQCYRHLEDSRKCGLGLLHAANAAHMSLSTILVSIAYSENKIDVMRSPGNEVYPGGPKEGGTVKEFRTLLDGISMSEHEKEGVVLLNDIRNRLQHPIPGPMGYIVVELIAGIEAAVRVGMSLWNKQYVNSCSGETICADALTASELILESCAAIRNGECTIADMRIPGMAS